MKNEVLIIGAGIVGRHLLEELKLLHPDVYDKYNPAYNSRRDGKYKLAFICVDTPYVSKDMSCDISEVENALLENDADIFVIKSTILPGTTDRLTEKTGKRIVMSPEYYGITHFTNRYSFDFTILGGEKRNCCEVVQVLQNVYDGRHRFAITSAKTAELVKYMENSFLAMKVSFCVQFWLVAKECGVDYEELRELFVMDPRINSSNTFVFEDHPYWESHCYDKDICAISSEYNMHLLQEMIRFNEEIKLRFSKNQ